MEAVLGLVGVIVGFLLSELSQSWRARSRIARARSAVTNELRSLHGQIPQLKDICNRAIKELRARTLLPTLAVPAMSSAYDANIEELQAHLTVRERNCLHIIYSRLNVADKVLSELEQDFRSAMSQSVFDNPFEAFADRLTDIYRSYDVIDTLIASFLKGEPIDVFYIEKK